MSETDVLALTRRTRAESGALRDRAALLCASSEEIRLQAEIIQTSARLIACRPATVPPADGSAERRSTCHTARDGTSCQPQERSLRNGALS